MAEYENFYTPDDVDEQIEAFLQARETSTRDQKLTHDLHAFYKPDSEADAHSLQRVLTQLLADDQHGQKIVPISDFMPKQQKYEETSIMRGTLSIKAGAKTSSTLVRRLNILVATLIVAVLVGSMLVVFNAARQSHNSTIGSPDTAEKLGKIIYQSSTHQLVFNLSWSPDGTRLAAHIDGTLQSWDATNPSNVVTYNIPATASGKKVFAGSFAWSPDSTRLAVAGGTAIYVFDAKTAAIQTSTPLQTPSPTAQPGSVGDRGIGKIFFSQAQKLSTGGLSLGNMTWSPDGRFLEATYNGLPDSACAILIWNAETGDIVETLNKGFNGNVLNVQWSPDGRHLASWFATSVLKIWDTITWSVVKQYQGVSGFSWSPDSKHLALLDAGKVFMFAKDARIVDALNGQTLLTFAKEGSMRAVQWSPDGTRIALEYQKISNPLGLQRTADHMKLWDAINGKLLYTFTAFPVSDVMIPFSEASWSPDSRYIACVSDDQRIIVWVAKLRT